MMKWGKKKPSSSSSSRPAPSVSPVPPISWLSRFKKMSIGSEPKPASTKPKGEKDSPSLSSTLRGGWNEGRFYGEDDDSYWRLSFDEERYEGQRSGDGLKSVWYDSDNELDVHFSSSQSFKLGKRRELPQHVEILQGKKDRKASKDQTPRKMTQRVLEEKLQEVQRETDKADVNSTKSVEKYPLEPEPAIIQTMEKDSSSFLKSTKIEEECVFEAMNSKQTTASSKDGKKRKSVRISRVLHRRTKQSRKFRVYSPRKAKALEDMKKAKIQMKMKKTTTAFDSFAVVKSSVNPEQDFRDSMFEMIIEKGIRRAEDMEELLACYLTLNCDDHHELIIKVFRQVWFDLNQVCFDMIMQREYWSKCDG